MASLNLRKYRVAFFTTTLAFAASVQAESTKTSSQFGDENIPNPEAIKAYKRFWDAFQSYENQKKKASVEEYQRARDGLESIYLEKEIASAAGREDALTASIQKYKENLERFPNASNRPYVLLSVGQMYAELASIQSKNHPDKAKNARDNALAALKNLDESFPSFAHNPEALYLRATILDLGEEFEASKKIWNKLADTGADRYTMYGNIVAGDLEFDNARPESAIARYSRAREILRTIEDHDTGLDELRVYYRMAWAYYKAGKNDEAIKSARKVMSPGVVSRSVRQKERITRDMADLIAFALYELDHDNITKSVIMAKDLSPVAGAISLRLMDQYITSNQPAKASQLAELAATEFALSREYPDILKLKAKAEEKLGAPSSRIETLEKLSMLLPAQSLWRHRHIESIDVIRHMEDLARNAAESVASSYYESAMSSGNIKKFLMAATYYNILLNDQIAPDAHAAIRLKIANCSYFANDLDDASKRYDELISSMKTPDETLQIAHFQRVLTSEKIWKASFESNVQKNIDPISNKSTLAKLKNLEDAVDQHANKYPAQTRSVDLLLVAASANRDHNQFERASKYWQRVLLSSPTQGQRGLAIRGLVFAKMRTSKHPEVIETVSNFLHLENTNVLGQNLERELLGVLSSAATEYAAELSKKGLTDEASRTLLNIASEFKNVPNREQIWRDGAYFAAISGNWEVAKASSMNYVKSNNKQFMGDMKYLIARSNEYQMRFGDAVTNYIDLAERYPSHERTLFALDRAEKLATAEENYQLAATAAKMLAERSKTEGDKLAAFDRAATYLVLAGRGDEAMNISETRKAKSSSARDKLEAGINIATIQYKTGNKQTAIDDLDSIEKQIERNKYELGDAYKRLAAIANMKLGEHALSQFREIKINEKHGDISAQVEKKSKIFAEIVTRFDKVASLDQQKQSPKARYFLAQSASDFADEITSISARSGEPMTLKTQSRFNQNIARLQDMAKKYHGHNLLSKQRAPEVYAKNEWISRSAIALTKGNSDQGTEQGQGRLQDQISNASSAEMPQMWSH